MDIENTINTITLGGTFARIEDALGAAHIVVLRAPSLQDRQLISFVYEEALRKAKEDGIFTFIELSVIYRAKNLWTEQDDKRIEALRVQLAEQKTSQSRIAAFIIGTIEKELDALLRRKYELFQASAEKHAEVARSNAVVYGSTYRENGTKWWPTWAAFESEIDGTFISNVAAALHNVVNVSTKELRTIARSPHWRFQWNAAKNIGELFGRPIIELSPEQQALLYWSQVYDNVYESMERPDDSIINDDARLDEWFENQDRKRKVEQVAKGSKNNALGVSQRVGRHGEIFIVANPAINPAAPPIQDIENLNDSVVKKFKATEREKIHKAGSIRETELRDRKNKIARKLIGSSDAIIQRNNFSGQGRGRDKKRLPGGTL
jgi:hypothetical protein